MKITYYGHSCFTVSSSGYTLALDPYNDMVQGYPPLALEANKVYCSHGHMDHAFVDAVTIKDAGAADPFDVKSFEIPHDDAGGSKRGMNQIRIFYAEGKKVIHFGDTGCIPDAAILEELKGADIAMIPVGGVFTVDPAQAKQIADAIAPRILIPMHYKKGSRGLQIIADLDAFLDLCKDVPYEVRPLEYKESIEI